MLREQTATFFLIEKENGASGEVFALCSGDSRRGVLLAEGIGMCTVALGAEDLSIFAAVEENEEAEVIAK